MMYTKAVFFKDGKHLTLTEQEAEGLKGRLIAGDRFVEVQGNFISADNIARIGNHEMSAEIKRVQSADVERSLLLEGKNEEVGKIRELKKSIAVRNHFKEREYLPELPMSEEEDARGDKMYYIGEGGQKMYS